MPASRTFHQSKRQPHAEPPLKPLSGPAHPLPVSGLLSWILRVMEIPQRDLSLCLSLSSILEVPLDWGGVSATLLVKEIVTVTLSLSSLGNWSWK